MKRTWIFVSLAVLLVAWISCTTVKHLQLGTVAQQQSASPDSIRGQPIIGYTTADAAYHRFDGYVRFFQPDSVHFYKTPSKSAPAKSRLSPAFALARADVASFSVRRQKTLATVGILVAVTTVVVVIAVATQNNNPPPPPTPTTSCPLAYSWDGGQFVLDAEPYGGATIQALERTDVTELEHLAPSNGRYRLLLTNEMEETQHTNQVELMVVDRAPGLVVAPDLEGLPHAFRSVHRLVEARDQAGHDLLPWLVEKDQATWHPDLEAASRHLPLADTRDHITLTFDRPAGVRTAYLLADAATAPWGARMLRPMLEMRGATLGLFYAAINADESARRKLHEWEEREELFTLGVEVEEGGRWVRQAHLIGGGPIAAETRAIPLDLSRVTGDRVRVRLHPPIGFWMFNAFRLAEAEAPVRVRVVAPLTARDETGKDVLASVIGNDKTYLTFVTNDDWGVLTFPCPSQEAGTARTVFARTRGWYEIRMRALGFPDLAEIDRLTNQPGYPVQFALRDFRERADSRWAEVAAGGPASNSFSRRN